MPETRMWTDAYPTLDGKPKELFLSKDQQRATFPEYAAFQERNPATTIHDRFKHPALSPGLGYQLGRGVSSSLLDSGSRWHRLARAGVLPAGLVLGASGAGLGALLGGGLGLVRRESGADAARKARIGAILGGVLGGGLGVSAGWGHRTKSAYYRQDVFRELAQEIRRAPGLNGAEKGAMIDASQRLSNVQAVDLIELIRGASGFTVGALIARFLLKAGVLGTVAGGLVGYALGPKRPRPYAVNAFGEAF